MIEWLPIFIVKSFLQIAIQINLKIWVIVEKEFQFSWCPVDPKS